MTNEDLVRLLLQLPTTAVVKCFDADTCEVIPITGAVFDPEQNNGKGEILLQTDEP